MRLRNMSTRKFADHVGVAHSVIVRLLDYRTDVSLEDRTYPSLETLVKLAKATGVDLRLLITLIVPDAVHGEFESLDSLVLSKQIEQLPDHIRRAVDMFIANLLEGEIKPE